MPHEQLTENYFAPGIQILWCCCMKKGFWNYKDLSSPHWRFYWNDREGSRVWLNEKAYNLTPDIFTVIPPNTPFTCERDRALEHFYIHFTARPPLDRIAPQILQEKVNTRIIQQIQEAKIELQKKGPRSIRLALLANALASEAILRIPSIPSDLPTWDSRVIHALHHMEHNLHVPLHNNELAEGERMSTSAFARLFREQTGETVQRTLTTLRVEKACRLLQHSDLSIEEIAFRTGFCDRYHLSRSFRRLRGMGPATYRKSSI